MATPDPKKPRTFFLNEKQELASFDREGGGRQSNYVAINWPQRSADLERSFRTATALPERSYDPVIGKHRFIVAVPVDSIEKHSKSKKALERGGIVEETPSFGGDQSKLFRKLGMDLIETLPSGKAAVHLLAAHAAQVLATISSLSNASSREQSRWINLDRFETLGWNTRVSTDWLESLPAEEPVPTMIRFQPMLSRLEVQDILQALVRLLNPQTERLLKADREFSGRYWCSGLLNHRTILTIASAFPSVQSLHPPLTTPLAFASRKRRSVPATPTVHGTASSPQGLPISDLPTVAVVDTGIPEPHPQLSPYRVPGGYRDPDLDPSVRYMGDHGSTVASCIVFGRLDMTSGVTPTTPKGICRVYDVMVSRDDQYINDEIVLDAMTAVVATAGDIRVFNLSFGNAPLDNINEVLRRERLNKLQNLDNFAFARDVLLVIAAGNSPKGILPEKDYPHHLDDPNWRIGAVARSFNGIVCGAFVDIPTPNAIAQEYGAPSPFTRIGPGLCNSPVPGFSAPGGDAVPNYQWAPNSGIWACSATGLWEDHVGTSYATPLIAREAAWAFKELTRYCQAGTRPFTATVKAWLNLVARRPKSFKGALEKLAQRTLGKGYAQAERLWSPDPSSAVFVWQTVLQMPRSVAHVQLPIPLDWLVTAEAPRLRIVACWETPVNYALSDSWGCRKVNLKIRPFGALEALRGSGNASGSYPLIDRVFNIHPDNLKEHDYQLSGAMWVIEVDYEEVGEYPPAMTFSPQQRVGVIIELLDESEKPVSPQATLQALDVTAGMTRLSLLQQPIQAPVLIRQ